MAKSKTPPTPKDPQGSKNKKSVRRFAPPIPTVPQQYQYPQSLPQYKSVDEINAIYNMFLQNYERTRMEGQRAANLKGVDQYINRGFRDPIKQPVAPQFRFPTALSRGAPPPQGPLPIPIPGPMPPGNKIPPFMPPPRLPSPSMPLPPKPSPKIPPSPIPSYGRPMPLPKQQLPPSGGSPRPVPDANAAAKNAAAAAKNAAAAAQQASPRKPAPKPKQVKPTLNSFIPRYERD